MSLDFSKPIEIAEDIFWVGYYVPDDPFQCHVYLIRNGEESILIDPGSELVLPVVLEKIYSLVPLKNIRYVVMHHQDPDITGCYSILEKLFPPGERYIVTHWRTQTLLKHYGWKTPFYLVDKNDWKLKAGERELEFIFTPYAHFPGAICTFDKKTKTLFSSDILGAISEKFFLFAEDNEDYYKGVEFFHKHYMPSKAVLQYALKEIMSRNPELIAPQHGSIIKKDMINKVVSRLKNLDCGLYLIEAAREESDIGMLVKIESWIRKLFNVTILSSGFSNVLEAIYKELKKEFPQVEEIVVKGYLSGGEVVFRISGGKLAVSREKKHSQGVVSDDVVVNEVLECKGKEIGNFIIRASEDYIHNQLFRIFLSHIKGVISVVLERELRYLSLEEETQLDPLTGVYNKKYLMTFLESLVKERKGFSIAFVDLDDFKKINDTYGHLAGDCVLKELAAFLRKHFRSEDYITRFGGEEFVIVAIGMECSILCSKMDKIRKEFEFLRPCGLNVSFSAGVTEFKDGDDVESILSRADSYLYRAKAQGKNRVVCG